MNIQKEPYFGVPGLILLPNQEARAMWYSLRDTLQSNLDYEIYSWYTYSEYEQMALNCHLKVSPLLDSSIVSASLDTIKNYTLYIDKFKEETINQINELPFLLNQKMRMINAVKQFCSECIAEHDSKLSGEIVEADLVYLYLKYYSHVFQMIVKHM